MMDSHGNPHMRYILINAAALVASFLITFFEFISAFKAKMRSDIKSI